MARVEKTVFISYRRKDISWALAVYQYLTGQKYDVFFDYTSLSGGDFEQVIVSNIRARAHFVLILTPTALDRCNEPGDWLRREIETAISEKRNIIPLFFDGFSFGSPSVAEKLTGNLAAVNRYNGLEVPAGYFLEGMERLRSRYLNVPLNAVLHPVPTEVRKVVKEEKVAADKAVLEKREDIQELVRPAEEKSVKSKQNIIKTVADSTFPFRRGVRVMSPKPNFRPYGISIGVLLIAVLGIFGINSLIQSARANETAAPTLGIGSTLISPKDGMTLLYVPAGEFIMGSDNGEADEKPVHTVNLDAFWIDQTEITNAMYGFCVQSGECNQPTEQRYFTDSNYIFHPIVYVTWNDANTYCSWAGRRLPTEAEWEKAARGNDGRTYPWGEEGIDCQKANYEVGCIGDTRRVGSYELGKSPYYAFDMAGNVWEWVSSLYQTYPYDPTDGREDLSAGGSRVSRGGGWYYADAAAGSSNRNWDYPTGSYNLIGFRCAMDASE